MAIGQRVKELREKRGWTQRQLASKSELDERTVRRLEGGAKCSLKTQTAVAAAFGLQLEELTTNSKTKDDVSLEIYRQIVSEWVTRADLDRWKAWTSWLLGHGQPRIFIEDDRRLEALRVWLISRMWPKALPELEKSLKNFLRVLQDFQDLFQEHAEPLGEDQLITKKFYHIRKYDPERYHRLWKEFNFHTYLVEDLVLELTRAANFVCDCVREYLDPLFRIKEGVLVIEHGPDCSLTFYSRPVEYSADERKGAHPYTGLEEFKKIRSTRDYCFGDQDFDE